MAPDPIIAAAGYLQQIPPAVRALADTRTTSAEWRLALGWASDGVIVLFILKSRFLPTMSRWLAPRLSRPWLLQPLLVLLFALALEVARLLISLALAAIWPVGASSPGALAASAPFRVFADTVLYLIAITAARRWPDRWWAGLSAGVGVLVVLLILVAPMVLPPAARGDRPVASSAGGALLAFAQRGGLAANKVYVFDSTDVADVDAEGLGPFAHLAVSRAALDAPKPQTYAALGHLLGHHRHKDLWSMTLLLAGVATLALLLVTRGTAPLARALAAPEAQDVSEPTALPVIALILWAFALPAAVAFDAFDRGINYRADAYALSLTHDPQGFARWLIDAESAGKADPAWLEMVLFYDHPPLKTRLVRAFRSPQPAP